MSKTSSAPIRLRRFPATPNGQEAHGTWRGKISSIGDATGGILTMRLTSTRQLFLAILGWTFRAASPQEYLVGYPTDETEIDMDDTAGVLVPTFGGIDVAGRQGIYVPVAVDDKESPIISVLHSNIDTDVSLFSAHGLWWDEALQRRLDVVPMLRP